MSTGNKATEPRRPDGRRNNRPPQHTRFKKGQSGNPRGRPKKPKLEDKAREIIARLLEQDIPMHANGETHHVTAFEGMMQRLLSDGLQKNNRQAVKQFLAIAEQFGVLAPRAADDESQRGGVLVVPQRPKTIAEWEAIVQGELQRRAVALGEPPPRGGDEAGPERQGVQSCALAARTVSSHSMAPTQEERRRQILELPKRPAVLGP